MITEVVSAAVTCVALLSLTYRLELPFAFARAFRGEEGRSYSEKDWLAVYRRLKIQRSFLHFVVRERGSGKGLGRFVVFLVLALASGLTLSVPLSAQMALAGSVYDIGPVATGAASGLILFVGFVILLRLPHGSWKLRNAEARCSYLRWLER
jgi:hypothetical protein